MCEQTEEIGVHESEEGFFIGLADYRHTGFYATKELADKAFVGHKAAVAKLTAQFGVNK